MSKEIRKLKDRMTRSLSKRAWADALDACLKLREATPGDERVLLRLGEVYQRLDRKKEAVAAFKEVVDLYADDGRLARAISVAKRIAEIDPEDESVDKKLALLYSARGLPVAPRTLRAGPEVERSRGAPAEEIEPASPGIDLEVEIEQADELFTESDEERLRRKLGSKELKEMDLADLDLALVELEVVEAPAFSPTPLFSDLAPEELHDVMRRLIPRAFQDEEAIVRQGERGESVFLICDGAVRVRVRKPGGGDVEVARLGEGTFFGEFGMFTDGRRHASVLADGPCELLELRHADLTDVARAHPRVEEVLVQYYRDRAMETALALSETFGRLDPAERIAVARMAEEESHPGGATVMKEGSESSGLYLVRRGRLLVHAEGLSGGTIELAKLSPGDFFGEVSALTGAPVTADVTALEPCELLKLSRAAILDFCNRWPSLREGLEAVRDRRLHETIERLGEAGLI